MGTCTKKYQVFVSSTYEDLLEERQEIMQALLELDCIPSGMELFPAADEDQWSLIKGVIDDCDYYIVIIAGRYGTVNADGVSYTEIEYRYAAERHKPIIAFLHKNPDQLPYSKTERSEQGREKLAEFKELAQKKMCKYWDDSKDLASIVTKSLFFLQRKHPGVGWVRGDTIANDENIAELLKLKNEVERLKNMLAEIETTPPTGTENLAQGQDLFTIPCHFLASDSTGTNVNMRHDLKISWDDLFSEVAPMLLHEHAEHDIWNRLEELFLRVANQALKNDKRYSDCKSNAMDVETRFYETIILQFYALGLIRQTLRQSKIITYSYWELTGYGKALMTRLRAISKPLTK